MNSGTKRMGDFHNCYFNNEKPTKFQTLEGISDSDLLDGLVYWCQRMRIKSEYKDRYVEFYKAAKKRFLK